MGLLDDAIREHLDLKRRRGADPAEIERAEREALGPVRRNRDTALAEDDGDIADSEYDAPGSAFDEPDEGIATDLADETDPPRFDDDLVTARGVPEDPPGTEDLVVVRDDGAFDDDDVSDDDPEFDDHEAPATRVMRAADIPPPAERTAEFDVEEALGDEDDPFADEPASPAPSAPRDGDEDDDVLEETPEFLQDTPDHDRLWFEQRPPRDFDFDG